VHDWDGLELTNEQGAVSCGYDCGGVACSAACSQNPWGAWGQSAARPTVSRVVGVLTSRSIYVFAKTPQIKKPDGKPLLRKDIQYSLLSYIFHDDKKVFTSSYDSSRPQITFSELYIESISRSSKCSRVVRDKLLSDRDLAVSVGMVSLLVNVGKMNTTLTCTFLSVSL
jgi:hypothetical protein